MLSRLRCFLGLFTGRQQGSVAVEFAIIVPVLALLVFGALDLGHAWYMKHAMQNSCREGARYATRYQTNSAGNRLLPSSLAPTIRNYILQTADQNGGTGSGLNSLLPADANAQVTPSGPAFTESDVKKLPLEDLTVTVTARKNWFVINSLVPGMADYVDITVAATMKCE
jgi:Flp pilus assembly protein TadG